MSDLKQGIRQKAQELGVDLIGFGAKERFAALEPRHNPFTIFPEGETVILVGQMIPRGAIRGLEEGTNTGDYGSFGYSWLDNQFLAQSTYDIVRFLEDDGWEACPIFPNPLSTGGWGVPVTEGREPPNVTPDFDYAAVACGLGVIGRNTEVLTPSLGHRQRFQMIITDAALDSDPLADNDYCADCGACAKACPLGAIDAAATQTRTVCGLGFDVVQVNFELCKKCPNGGMTNRLHHSGKPDRYAAACNRACMAALEARGVGALNNPFRTHETWAKDRSGRLL